MFMYGGGKGMGGGGGNMLRIVGRSVTRAGVSTLQQEPISSSTSASSAATASNSSATSPTANSRPTHKTNHSSHGSLTLSSSASGPAFIACNGPVSPTYWPPFAGPCSDDYDYDYDYEWVSVDDPEPDAFALGPVPSIDEVHSAVSALTHVFDASSYPQLIRDKFTHNEEKDLADTISSPTGLLHRVSSVGSEVDWMEPSPYMCDPRAMYPYGSQRVYDAFHILQTEPSVQRMVVSISSDPAVWDAVLNNKVVRELRDTYYADENNVSPDSESSEETGNEPNPAMDFIRWIFDNTKAKVGEVIDMITTLVNQLFKPHGDKETTAGAADQFEERLRTSFLLSVMVLLIVVVTRAQRA